MRSDATRNHEAILSAAIAVLADAPGASMQEIADASGTGRTTLYRHFPHRQALVDAIYRRVLTEADALAAAALARAGERDPVSVLSELGVALAGFGDRYGFLERHLPADRQGVPDSPTVVGHALRDYLVAAQGRGALRADLDGDWLFALMTSTIMSASRFRFASSAERERSVAAALRSLLGPAGSAQRA